MIKKKEKTLAGVRKATKDEAEEASTGDLRPAPQRNVFKIGLKSLGILVLALLFALLIFKLKNQPKSQILIKAQAEKFHVGFQLTKSDQPKAAQVLEKLQIPQDILSGFDFTLDSASSAKLAWAAPITINLDSQSNSLQFQGETKSPLVNSSTDPPQNFKMPKQTAVAIFTNGLLPIFTKSINPPEDFKSWQEQNIVPKGGQFFTVATDNSITFTYIPQKNPDYDSLSKLASGDNLYKEENFEDVTIHIYKLSEKEEKTVSIFQINTYVFMTTATDVKDIIKIQKDEADSILFPKTNSPISLALFLKEDEQTSDSVFAPLTNQSAQIQKYLKGTKELFTAISGKNVSGYVNF